jgi:hypothetical protein
MTNLGPTHPNEIHRIVERPGGDFVIQSKTTRRRWSGLGPKREHWETWHIGLCPLTFKTLDAARTRLARELRG